MSPRWKGWHGEQGHYDAKRRVIRLTPSIAEYPEEVLLHEMCHIGTKGHGSAFLAKLDHLATLDDEWVAKWAKDEASLIRNSPPWNIWMLHYLVRLDDWAEQFPRPAFLKVVRAIAGDLRMSQRELLKHRRVWLKRAWEKARTESTFRRELLAAMDHLRRQGYGSGVDQKHLTEQEWKKLVNRVRREAKTNLDPIKVG